MPKKEIRFGAAKLNRLRSPTWKVWCSNRDIYATHRGIGNAVKMSIHGSGQCHVAFHRQYLDQYAPSESPLHENRYALKWRRPDDIVPGVYHGLTILIPEYVTSKPGMENEPKSVIWIPSAEPGQAVEIAVLIQHGDVECEGWPTKRSMGTELLGDIDCALGKLWLVYQYIPMPTFNLGLNARSTRFTQTDREITPDDDLGAVFWGIAKEGFPFMVSG